MNRQGTGNAGPRSDSTVLESKAVMVWFTLGTFGGIAIAGTTAVYIKQAIIDRAKADTDGYF